MILIKKVKDPYGWLGNMSPYEVEYKGNKYRTAEALFQSLRFNDQEIINSIKEKKSPMAVKMFVKKHKDKMIVQPQSEQDLDNMKMVLNLKISQHDDLRQKLLDTGNETILEDCTNRPRGSGVFWGAALKRVGESEVWVGDNHLGNIWMKIRQELRP